MKVSDFDYHLPESLIAQTPIENRSASRMLVVNRDLNTFEHKHFYQIEEMLTDNDVLILNNTKVMPARLFGQKIDTAAVIECLLLKELTNDVYEVLVRPARRVHKGTKISFGNRLIGEVIDKFDEGISHMKMHYQGIFLEVLDELGEMPLPPYIHEKLEDKDRYQTVYAKVVGSAAAPTAGLHFTNELLSRLQQKGITIAYVTLHVGLGTFRPMSVETVEKHHMHKEMYWMDEQTAKVLNQAKMDRKRIVAVGTTSIRTLESIYKKYGKFVATCEETNLFIYPGYSFLCVDALITNFHLPKSTLLMLVSAFASRNLIMESYEAAIKEKYRFFSFGDAMFIR